MPLPSFNGKYVAALRSSFLRFPGNLIPIHEGARDSYTTMEKNLALRRASVLVPLCNRHGVPSVLFTVRTKTVSSHKGHVSFPGGHREGGETAEEAALRELREELYGLAHTGGQQARAGSTDIHINSDTDQSEGPAITVLGQCQTIPALTVSFGHHMSLE